VNAKCPLCNATLYNERRKEHHSIDYQAPALAVSWICAGCGVEVTAQRGCVPCSQLPPTIVAAAKRPGELGDRGSKWPAVWFEERGDLHGPF